MKRADVLIGTILIEFFVIISIAIANILGGNGFYLFYNVVYGLVISTLVPIFIVYKKQETLTSIGIKKFGLRQACVVAIFIIFSIGGQFIPIVINSVNLEYELLKIGLLPLIMTTFFEEFLFRGFMQTRFEKAYGSVLAIILSAMAFSVYHLGYPGFRSVNDLLLLYAVGIGFALAYKLSGNNLIVSYLVNLPNALLTYVLKSKQFPKFNSNTAPFAAITIIMIVIIMYVTIIKLRKEAN